MFLTWSFILCSRVPVFANTCKIKLTRQPFFFPLHWVIYRHDILCSHPARGSGGGFRGWAGPGHFCPVLGAVPWLGWVWVQCEGDCFTTRNLLSLTKTIFRSTPLAWKLVTRIYVRCPRVHGLGWPTCHSGYTQCLLIGNDVKQGVTWVLCVYLCLCLRED